MDLQSILVRLRALASSFTTAQLVSLGVSFVLVVGIIGGSAFWLNQPTYALLFADMDEESAGQVVSRLKTLKVPYVLDEGPHAALPAGGAGCGVRVRDRKRLEPDDVLVGEVQGDPGGGEHPDPRRVAAQGADQAPARVDDVFAVVEE